MNITSRLATVASLVVLCLHAAESSIYTISDERVRNKDITPVLGRGYSIMTNSYHSTCLMVDETTVPSYNYDYYFTEINSSSEFSGGYQGKFSYSFGWWWTRGHVSGKYKGQGKVQAKSHFISSTMRIERYYSSVKEEVSPLSPDAISILADEDYVGFFKACGPNYIRGIRRAQEVTSLLYFSTSNREGASEFKYNIRTSGWWNGRNSDYERKSKYKSANSSLIIMIKGYGMGLSQEGSETMVATTVAEYQQVMKFAFKSMTQADDSHHIGMVYGMEVVPWVHNTEFQFNARLGDDDIIIPMPRSLIPKAYLKLAAFTANPNRRWGNVAVTRNLFRCKDTTMLIDKYGYCCEVEQLMDVKTNTYRTVDNYVLMEDVCKPMRSIDKGMMKDNMANNGEFVARLDSAMRYKLNVMGTLEKCISTANSIPNKYLDYLLKPIDTVKHERTIEYSVTLRQLRLAIDPSGDYSMLKHMGFELDEWIDMYYSPCYAALYGTNIGSTPDVDVSYFQAYPWFSHPECMRLSCLSNSMRWDRKAGGGCVPGLINGQDAQKYGEKDEDGKKCSKDTESYETEECKHKQKELSVYEKKVKDCWTVLSSGTNVDYMVNNYCMPDIKTTFIKEIKTNIDKYRTCRGLPATPARRKLSVETSSVKEEKEEVDATVPLASISEDESFVNSLKMKIENSQTE